MRRFAALAAVLAFALPGAADARGGLGYGKARAQAQKAAAARARRQHDIVGWELKSGYRFTGRKWVFVWYGQLRSGRGCGAQLVVRFRSSSSSSAVTYFRNEQCS